jgi:uncharacterized protein (TIGR02246 family)
MTRRFTLVLLLAVCGGFGLAHHDQPGKKGDRSAAGKEDRAADREAIRKTFQQLLKALGKGDADAVASFWTDSGEYVDQEGEIIHGRKALAAAYKGFFTKNKGVRVEGKARDLRFLGQDAAVAEGSFSRHAAGELPATTSHFTALVVREKGQWRLAQLREEERREPAKLDDLKWLIGDWEAKTKDRQVSVHYALDDKKAFIRGRFVVREKGKEVLSGEQIIGRDAAEGVLRSWVFESEGGFGSGVWQRDGKQWVVESEGTQADGTVTTSVNVLTPVDVDTFTWQSQDRSADGEEKPDTVPVKVKRVKKGK